MLWNTSKPPKPKLYLVTWAKLYIPRGGIPLFTTQGAKVFDNTLDLLLYTQSLQRNDYKTSWFVWDNYETRELSFTEYNAIQDSAIDERE